MQVLVIGANGNTGFRVVQELAASPHEPVAMIRNAAQRARFDALRVPTVLGDLEYPIDHACHGCDAVIFAAGSGGKTGKDKTVLVDHLGAIRAAVTALQQGAVRFIMLSALNGTPDAKTRITHYHRAKGRADQFLREMPDVMEGRSLDWTTVHPGGLHDEPAGDRVRISPVIVGEGTTSRATLAKALVACLDLPSTIGRSFALLDGDTLLKEALKSI